MIQKQPQRVGVQLSAPFFKLGLLFSAQRRPSAFHQNSGECHTINSSFLMQPIRDSCSNHHVHGFVPCRLQFFSHHKSWHNTKMKLPELFFGWVKRSKDAKLAQLNPPTYIHFKHVSMIFNFNLSKSWLGESACIFPRRMHACRKRMDWASTFLHTSDTCYKLYNAEVLPRHPLCTACL